VAKTAIALIVAGSGEITAKETFDLLEDAYPQDDYEEIGLVVPVDKDLYTDAVKHAVEWFGDAKAVQPVQTNGASLSRASAKLGEDAPNKVDKFSDILTQEEFKDWDEVHFIVAIPSDQDDPDYDLYAEMVEAAIDGGLTVKNLAAGLDDVELADDEPEPEDEPVVEPDPEPEVEEEKPAPRARRSRAKKVETEEDPVVAEALAKIVDEPEEESNVAGPPKYTEEFQASLNVFGEVVKALEAWDVAIAAFDGKEVSYRPLTAKARAAWDDLAGKPTLTTDDPDALVGKDKVEDKPTRGRGRPRTKFEVKQVWDEDEEYWIPRPMGRLPKGTKFRSIHSETNEVLEEGKA
jgi:hypothetical protein